MLCSTSIHQVEASLFIFVAQNMTSEKEYKDSKSSVCVERGGGIYNNQGHQERGAKEAVCPGPHCEEHYRCVARGPPNS